MIYKCTSFGQIGNLSTVLGSWLLHKCHRGEVKPPGSQVIGVDFRFLILIWFDRI